MARSVKDSHNEARQKPTGAADNEEHMPTARSFMDKSQTQDNSDSRRRRGPHQQEQTKASLIVKTGLSRSKKQTENQTHRARNSLCHVIATTTKVQNKQSILKAAREKEQLIYEGRSIRISRFFHRGHWKPEENGLKFYKL